MFSRRDSISNAKLISFSKSIYKDYLSASFDNLKSFYEADYKDIESFGTFSKTNNIEDSKRAELVSKIEAYNKAFNCSKAVLSNIDKLKENSCFTVIGGQQPGLLTGPLYTIYKVITLLKLSAYINDYLRGEFSVVPIFWVASEDHDLAEVNKFTYQETNGNLRNLSLRSIEYSGLSLDKVPIPPIEYSSFIDDLFPFINNLSSNTTGAFNKTAFSSSIHSLLCNAPAYSFSKHFVYLLSSLFKEKGLIIVEPHLFRTMEVSINKAAIERDNEIKYALRTKSLSLQEGGYNLQIPLDSNVSDNSSSSSKSLYNKGKFLSLFYLDKGKRKKIYYDEGKKDSFIIDKVCFSKAELLEEVSKSPSSFSHSVVLRSLVQDMLFPNIATVGGPGEIAYFAQLKGIYNIFKRRMPIIYPRASITLVEKKIAKIEKLFSLSITDILNNDITKDGGGSAPAFSYSKEGMLDTRIEGKEEVIFLIEEMRKLLLRIGDKSDKAARDIKESMNPSFRKLGYELNRLEDRFLKKCEEKEGISRKQLHRLKCALYPRGHLQERVFNIFTYINLYGMDMIDHIMESIDIRDYGHKVLYYD